MNWVKKKVGLWVLGKAEDVAEHELEKAVEKIPKSRRTTMIGIFLILSAVGQAGIALFDGDSNTHPDLGFISLALTGGATAILAREQKSHDEAERIRKELEKRGYTQ